MQMEPRTMGESDLGCWQSRIGTGRPPRNLSGYLVDVDETRRGDRGEDADREDGGLHVPRRQYEPAPSR